LTHIDRKTYIKADNQRVVIPIIIVSYRNPADVVECLEALQESEADPRFDVYVCENGGTAAFETLVSSLNSTNGRCACDITNAALTQMGQFAQVRMLRLRGREVQVSLAEAKENIGYAGGVNAWLRVLMTKSTWPGFWILNPDTRPQPRALAELVAYSTARQKGMVGSCVVSLVQPQRIQTRGLRWRRLKASTGAVDMDMPSAAEPDVEKLEAYIEAPSGVSIYVTRRCLERIGLMDERYFLYFEDLDWGYRARRACGIGYAHRSVVQHRGGTTIGSGHSRSTASSFAVYLEFRNRLTFVRQHHPSWIAWTVFILVLRSFEYAIVGAFANVGAALRGLMAGITGETGRPDLVFEFHGGTPRFRSRH
jgi:N-acetylglucosaminyl-diphospho-decaprenol L-rhamnosyltransferase